MTRPPMVVYVKPQKTIDRAFRPDTKHHAEAASYTPPKGKQNPLKVAEHWLGRRLEERATGYFLDRVPASLDTIVREMNRVLVANGLEQVTASDKWLV